MGESGAPPGNRRSAGSVARTLVEIAALFSLALIPRLSAVWQGFVTPDEPFWVYSSIRFMRALETRRWADTFQIGHPGVTTMWVGLLGVWWQRWRQAAAASAHLAWIDKVPWIAPDNHALFPRLVFFLPWARVAMATLHSLGVVGVYALARKLWNRRLALLGAALLALDPFVIGLSGLLHVDAQAALWMTVSILAWLRALQAGAGRQPSKTKLGGGVLWSLLSGVCAGLSVLSKSAAIVTVGAVGAATIWFLIFQRPPAKRLAWVALLGLTWGIGMVGAAYAAFPAMWVEPLEVVGRILGLAQRYGAAAHRITFYRGRGGDPGPSFYPTVFLFRLTPVTLIGALFSFVSARRSVDAQQADPSGLDARWKRTLLASLWTAAIGFTAVMSVGQKKFDRYLLPAFPMVDLLAAVGWVEILSWLGSRSAGRTGAAAGRAHSSSRWYVPTLIALLAVQGAMILPGWPYYLDAYNPLAGGMRGALRTLPVGWGEGLEQAADYLNRRPGAAEWVVAGASPVTLGPLFQGEVIELDESSRWRADSVLITALDIQVDPERVARLISGTRLAHTVRVGGSPVLWLYDVQNNAEAEHLALYSAPDDLVLCDALSSYARQAAQGKAPTSCTLMAGADESEIVALLNDWSARRSRLWYLAYPALAGSSRVYSPFSASVLRRQLETHAVRLEHVDLGPATATLYILPDQPLFAVEGDQAARALFAGQLAITDGLLAEPVLSGGSLAFRLRWQALAVPPADYMPFVHLLDDTGHLRAAGRGEELLVDERYWPTSLWTPEQSVERDYLLGLPDGLPPGRYRIAVGLADPTTQEWLPVVDAEGRIVDTTADLLPVQIDPPATPPDPDAVHLGHRSDAGWRSAASARSAALRFLGHSAPSHAQAGEQVVVEAGWTSAEAAAGHPGQDLEIALGLIGPSGKYALRQTLPLSRYPTSRWRAGEVIHELYDLRLPAELPGGVYTLALALLDERGQTVPLDDGTEIVRLDALRVSVQDRLFELPRPPQQPLALSLGSTVTLLGYDLLAPASSSASDRVSLTLYWRAEGPMETSYSAFVHLLDEAGRVQGQRDRVPMEGRAPTSGWIAGQVVVDEYEIPLNPGAPAGTFRIEVGMYDAEDMTRLQMVDAEGRALPGDRYLLPEEVRLEPAP